MNNKGISTLAAGLMAVEAACVTPAQVRPTDVAEVEVIDNEAVLRLVLEAQEALGLCMSGFFTNDEFSRSGIDGNGNLFNRRIVDSGDPVLYISELGGVLRVGNSYCRQHVNRTANGAGEIITSIQTNEGSTHFGSADCQREVQTRSDGDRFSLTVRAECNESDGLSIPRTTILNVDLSGGPDEPPQCVLIEQLGARTNVSGAECPNGIRQTVSGVVRAQSLIETAARVTQSWMEKMDLLEKMTKDKGAEPEDTPKGLLPY